MMPIFQYEAINERGRKIKGIIDADTSMDAKQKLIRRQILVTAVTAMEPDRGVSLRKSQVLTFTRELVRLLGAGLPLYESLSILEEKYHSERCIHKLLLELCDQIRSGQPFSRALQRHKGSFDVLYTSMVANAEHSGHLAKTLKELVCLIERQQYVQKTLFNAFLYPALLSAFCLVVLSVLLFFVVPSLFELFEGRSLHPFTSFVFACSKLALRAKWGLAALLGATATGIGWSVVSLRGRILFRKAMLRIPMLSDLLAKAALARFFRASATLIEGGLPAMAALQQAKLTMLHPMLERSIDQAMVSLSQGEVLSKALEGRLGIPSMVPRMLGIAIEGGDLPSMMHQIASIYEEDLEKMIQRVTSLIQPILLLTLGAIVGFVLLSVLLPLTDVSTFAT
jgi:general secretion pathway protein F